MIKMYKRGTNYQFREKFYKVKVLCNLIADVLCFILLYKIRTSSCRKDKGKFPISISSQNIKNANFFNSQKEGNIALNCQNLFIYDMYGLQLSY